MGAAKNAVAAVPRPSRSTRKATHGTPPAAPAADSDSDADPNHYAADPNDDDGDDDDEGADAADGSAPTNVQANAPHVRARTDARFFPRRMRNVELTMEKFTELQNMKLSQAARAFGMGATQARALPGCSWKRGAASAQPVNTAL